GSLTGRRLILMPMSHHGLDRRILRTRARLLPNTSRNTRSSLTLSLSQSRSASLHPARWRSFTTLGGLPLQSSLYVRGNGAFGIRRGRACTMPPSPPAPRLSQRLTILRGRYASASEVQHDDRAHNQRGTSSQREH